MSSQLNSQSYECWPCTHIVHILVVRDELSRSLGLIFIRGTLTHCVTSMASLQLDL